MHSVFHIKVFILFAFLLGYSQSIFAQSKIQKYKVELTLKKEHSKHYHFDVFTRGLDNYNIGNRLDSLTKKSRSNWHKSDSLSFAQTNIMAKNYELANHYYKNISIHPIKEYADNLNDFTLGYITKSHQKTYLKIKNDYPKIEKNSELYFFKKLLKFQDSINDHPNWYKSKQAVFTFNIDSNIWVNKKNKDQYIPPIKNAEKALNQLVFYIHDNDYVISRAFRDIGVILENHVSLTQAYIAYSIGRNYNKNDNLLIDDLKRIKAKLINKNYSLPIFRKYFPKTKKWRFDYEILKEKIIKEQSDTIVKHIPNFKSDKIKIDLPFAPDLIMPFGFLIIFILLIIFLKTKKK